jgi:hypothetical protein
MGPEDAPWHVDLIRRVDFGTGSESAGRGVASAEGIFEAQDQAEGPLRVVVLDGHGNIYATREISVVSAGAEQVFTLDVAALDGIVELGERPLPSASLLFGGSGGKEKVRASANEEGRFHVVLPHRGKWPVDVESNVESVAASTEVSVSDDAKDITIRLPSTEVAGWVSNSSGQRSTTANVLLLSAGKPMVRSTDQDGAFHFRGVTAGEIVLSATDRISGEYSPHLSAVLPKDGRVEGIELEMNSLRTIRGVVRLGGHPVIGASVIGYAFAGGSAKQDRAVTDINGAFAFDVPASAPEMNLMVAALGRVFHPFQVAAGEPVTLDLAPAGGELQLRWSGVITPHRVFFNDVPVHLHDLMEWSRANDRRPEPGSIVLPSMAPGRYQFCIQARCVEGVLAIGGRLELTAAE